MFREFFHFLFTTPLVNLIFVEVLYRPFFNLLVIIYQNLAMVGIKPDMGIAVIIFTIILRLILLPVSLREEHTMEEKIDIEEKIRSIKPLKSADPIKYKKERDKIISSHRHMFFGEIFDIVLQVWVAIMLWRIFTVGLEGADFGLLYSFIKMPNVPFNLNFLGTIDLSRPSLMMNLFSSFLIFVVETLNLEWSVIPPSSTDRWVQFIFPVGAFLYLYGMPAGKKLFVISTLLFTLAIIVFKEIRGLLKALKMKGAKKGPAWQRA